MAAGTVVSRLSGFVRSALLVAALGNGLHADLFNIANTVPNMLYILLAGGIFNAVLVPAAGAGDEERRRRRRGLHQPRHHAGRRSSSARVTVLLVRGRALGDERSTSTPSTTTAAGRPAGVGHRLRPLLPAAGLLLRHVRPGRPDPQLPWPVRADDVGADRQQPDRGRGARGLPGGLRPDRGAERRRRFTRGQEALLGLGSTLGIVAQLLILLPYLRPPAPLPAAVRLPGHRARPHPAARRLDRPLRGGQPDRLHRGGPARLRWYGRRAAGGADGTGLHGLLADAS